MTSLMQLMDLDLLDGMVEQGYVVRRHHRHYPLAILNYTDKAQFSNVWNDVTRQCRGLIYNTDTQKIVARPFKKFFNYGQPGADEIDLYEPAYVTDKMDGSLGIIYFTPDGAPAVATRGSFHSEQAEWATEWLREHGEHDGMYVLTRGEYTDLVEIVYPENRIVVDYGERAELVYLGTVEIANGKFCRSSCIALPYARGYGASLSEALSLDPRENAEGVVVMTVDGRAVKLKQEDYLLKHRARFNLTPKRIWETIVADITLDDFLEGMPDEFHDAIEETWHDIEDKGLEYATSCLGWANHARSEGDRKAQAAYIQRRHPDKAAGIFAALDGDAAKLTRAAAKYMEPTGPEASQLIA